MREKNKRIYFLNAVTGRPMDGQENVDLYKDIKDLIKEDDAKIHNTLLYNDCHDLNQKEIDFFVLWNNFKESYESNEKHKAYDNIEELLNMFIDNNLDYIKENGLINELTLFLNFLLDIGEISFTFFYLWTIKIN